MDLFFSGTPCTGLDQTKCNFQSYLIPWYNYHILTSSKNILKYSLSLKSFIYSMSTETIHLCDIHLHLYRDILCLFTKGTCIKSLIWPPLEPTTENCFFTNFF